MILTATRVVLPVCFVLALGYFAGRARKFGPDQVAGLSELVLDYALPAMLFVATVQTPRERLLSEGAYALALLIAVVGLFLVVVFVSTRILHHSLGEAALQANLASFPSVAFFGPPIFLAGLSIAAYEVKLSAEIIMNTLIKMVAQPLLMAVLVMALGIANPLRSEEL